MEAKNLNIAKDNDILAIPKKDENGNFYAEILQDCGTLKKTELACLQEAINNFEMSKQDAEALGLNWGAFKRCFSDLFYYSSVSNASGEDLGVFCEYGDVIEFKTN